MGWRGYRRETHARPAPRKKVGYSWDLMPGRGNSRIQDIVRRAGLVDDLQLRSALARWEQWGGFLPKILVELGFVNEETMVTAIAKAVGVPVLHLGSTPRDGNAMAKISDDFCTQHGVFPVSLKDRVLTLAMIDPTELSVIDAAGSKVGARVQPGIATPTEVLAAIARHYHGMSTAIDYRNQAPRQSVRMQEEQLLELDASAPPPPNAGSAGGAKSAYSDPLPPAPPPAPTTYSSESPLRPGRAPSANTMLDELVGDPGDLDLTADELKRVEAVKTNQDKASAILRALEALLKEKGLS